MIGAAMHAYAWLSTLLHTQQTNKSLARTERLGEERATRNQCKATQCMQLISHQMALVNNWAIKIYQEKKLCVPWAQVSL
jgi:hypothetical protein